MTIILEVRDLYKSFGKIKAVRGPSFQVPKGCCFGLLGPNGAGKSTTIEMIEGIREPDQGEILYKGQKRNRSFYEELGVQFQSTALPPKLTVRETLEMFTGLYRKSKSVDELVITCQLHEFQNQRHEKLSGGQRQRLLLAIALCHDPELLLLDEPTTGLDPQARRHLWEIVQSIKAQNKTIILTTHYMDEAQVLCDDIGIMDHGTIIARGSPSALLSHSDDSQVIKLPRITIDPEVRRYLNTLGKVFEHQDNIEIHTNMLTQTMQILSRSNIDLNGMNIRQKTLEDFFLELTGKELRS